MQSVFRALADPTRREILGLLSQQDMTIADVSEHFDITRAAVKKHLIILEEGDLITVRAKGTSRINRLHARALFEAHDWIGRFSQHWDDRLVALSEALTEDRQRKTKMIDSLTKSIFFPSPPEDVWAFLTDKDKLGLWYHPAVQDLEEGKPYELIATDKAGKTKTQVWGDVLKADKPRELICTFQVAPFGDAKTTVQWLLVPMAGGTRLTLNHEGIVAASGAAATQLLAALDAGWDEHIQALRSLKDKT